MGRVKLQIKRIENTTNRQVTFSKRRNGLIKKAYELSVLCDVDVALIMFSPSGRVSHFAGNKSIEEILARYVNLPEHERGRLQNQEFLQKALIKLKGEADIRTCRDASPMSSTDSKLEEIQQEILSCKSQLEDMQNRLRVFEGDPSEIISLCEAEYREQILKDTLRRVHMRKQVLEQNSNSSVAPPTSEVQLPQNSASGIMPENPTSMLGWLPERDPQVQILNFLDSNGLLPLRSCQSQNVVEILAPALAPAPPTLLHGQDHYMNLDCHISPRTGVVDVNNVQRPDHFVQAIDVNLSPWSEICQTGNGQFQAAAVPAGARALLELYLSQISTPSTILTPNQHPR